jgi:hypothetical protein
MSPRATGGARFRESALPEFGPMVADEIGEVEWQMWVDRLGGEGLSRSRIAGHVSVASAIYAAANRLDDYLRRAREQEL